MKTNLTLQKFDVSRIKDTHVVVFIGKRNTGKSFLIRDILFHHRNLPLGTVISGTEAANGFYSSMVPELFIHHDYSPEVVHSVVHRQHVMVNRSKGAEGASIDPRAFLILDDLMADSKTWIKDPNIKSMFFNGRHYKLFFLLSMQFALGIPPELRSNIDFVFILREPYMSNRKRLYEHYAGMFGSLDAFSQVMDQCTENFECLVIDNTSRSNKINEQVFWYKAEEHEDFKIGSKQFWDVKRNDDLRRRRNESLLNQPTPQFGRKASTSKVSVHKKGNNRRGGGDDGDSGGSDGESVR